MQREITLSIEEDRMGDAIGAEQHPIVIDSFTRKIRLMEPPDIYRKLGLTPDFFEKASHIPGLAELMGAEALKALRVLDGGSGDYLGVGRQLVGMGEVLKKCDSNGHARATGYSRENCVRRGRQSKHVA